MAMNPVEARIAAGMSPILAFLSEATCGEACWEAREDVCRCSCGGKNHGCLRAVDGVRPPRTAKIDGFRYELKAVGEGVWEEAKRINQAAGIKFIYASSSRDRCFANIPAKIRPATDTQIAKWPELAAYREGKAWTDDEDQKHYLDKPYLLWIKVV